MGSRFAAEGAQALVTPIHIHKGRSSILIADSSMLERIAGKSQRVA
jgi:hypothetical protein